MEKKSIIIFLFILQAIINDVILTIAQSEKKDRHVCRGGDFKSQAVRENRASALNELKALLKKSSYNGFQHTQVGDNPKEQVSASFLCSRNSVKGICECCLTNVIEYILKYCPDENEGVAWDFYPSHICMVRYSTGSKIFSVLDDWAWYHDRDYSDVSAVDLKEALESLVDKLKVQAAGGGALHKYALGNVTYDGDEHALHVSVQCTPDLSKEDCIKCLSGANTEIRRCCTGTTKPSFRGKVFSTNCYIWFSHLSFLDVPPEFKEKIWFSTFILSPFQLFASL